MEQMLHVRVLGKSEDRSLETMGLNLNSSEDEVRSALAQLYEKPASAFSGFSIVREANGITVRPEASFGV